MKDGFLKRLFSSNLKCKSCDRYYDEDSINVIGHREETWFLSATCEQCRTHALIAAVVKETRTTKPVSDLAQAEYQEVAGGDPIGVNEVLDMHNFLRDYRGNLTDLM